MKRNLCGFATAGPFVTRIGVVAASLGTKARRHSHYRSFRQSGEYLASGGIDEWC